MKKTNFVKRALSFAMAAFIALPSGMGAVRSEAANNDDYYIRFYDTTTKEYSYNTTIVEGAPITIQAKLPKNYQFTNPPFYITEKKSSSTDNKISNFEIQSGNSTTYTLTSKDISETNVDSIEYSLDAQYSAPISNGEVNIDYTDINTSVNGKANLYVESEANIPITEDSKLVFTVATNQPSDTFNSLTFNKITEATGYFQDKFQGQTPSIGSSSSSNNKSLTIYIPAKQGDAGSLALNLTIDISSLSGIKFGKDTTFEILFKRRTISPIIATVITREKAVYDTKEHIEKNPTIENVTVSGEPYIQLTKGETLKSIQNSFSVLSNIHRYNVDVDVDWKWEPDSGYENCQNFVAIQKSKNPSYMSVEILSRPENDFSGKLKFTVKYEDATEEGSVPVTFYGTGKTPEVQAQFSYKGQQNGDDIQTLLQSDRFGGEQIRMDVYNGKTKYFDTSKGNGFPAHPYMLTAVIYFGEGRGRASYAVINQISSGGEIEVLINNSTTPYKLGDNSKDGDKIETAGNYVDMQLHAMKAGQTKLEVKFYNENKELMTRQTVSQSFYVEDNTPSSDGTLKSLDLKATSILPDYAAIFKEVHPDNIFDYNFDKNTNSYSIQLPNCVEKITLTPTLTVGSGAYEKIAVSTQVDPVQSGKASNEIALEPNIPKRVTVSITAEDSTQNNYTLDLLRLSPSTDATLSAFEARSNLDTKINLITNFSPSVRKYEISVPYSVKEVTVTAVPNSTWAKPVIDGAQKYTVKWAVDGQGASLKPLSIMTRIIDFFRDAKITPDRTFIISRPVKNPDDGTYPESAQTVVTAGVTAENGNELSYELTINSLPPNTDTLLQSLSVTAITASDEGGTVSTILPFVNYDFDPETKDYLVRIPYSTSAVKISAQANDEKTSQNLELTSTKYPNFTKSPEEYKPHMPRVFTVKDMNPVPFTEGSDPNLEAFSMNLEVTAESEDKTNPPYTIEFQREDPNDDTSLKSLTLTDQNGTAIPEFSFNAQKLEYDITVPFLTTNVTATPVQNYHLSTIKVNDKLLTKTQPSFTTKVLLTGSEYVMTIVVTAEDYSQRTYTINITREDPSDEARLSALTVGSLKLEPKFNPNTLKYNVTIPEGTDGIIVTPTASSPYATITVDKMATESGKPSHKISPLDANSKIHIVVTAQDGKTTKTYILNVTDENLITKSDNADLYSLAVVTADLNPKFNASVTEYEAYVKEDVYSVDIIPKTANRYADVTVYADSRKIGDYDDNYSVSLFDDETEVTVEVVSQDGKVTNEYVVTILRGDEERQGKYAPIDEEDVNFEEADPIRIDITKYPLVSGEVFNTLKTEYPDKSILFTGNDYTLTIKGSDITTLVPNTDYYDLSITFSPPNEEDIWDTITDLDSDNYDLEPVFIHFNHHGTLPGPMKFTISLGTEYRNREMYWYYYNEERERIDYYGYVLTNAKGSFALPLTHMSTYVTVEDKILEAENKVGASIGYDNPGSPESLSGYFNGKKENPNTGAEVK